MGRGVDEEREMRGKVEVGDGRRSGTREGNGRRSGRGKEQVNDEMRKDIG